MYAFFVSDVTAGTKTRRVFQDRTKSGGKKSYGPKWESSENVGTKMWFSPNSKKHTSNENKSHKVKQQS